MTRNDHRLPRSRVMLAYLAAVTCGFASAALRPAPAAAAGVVGTGTPESCTDAALNVALAGGGLVTFNCGPDLVTVDISAGTGSKAITEDTTIDGGAMITISGGGGGGLSDRRRRQRAR